MHLPHLPAGFNRFQIRIGANATSDKWKVVAETGFLQVCCNKVLMARAPQTPFHPLLLFYSLYTRHTLPFLLLLPLPLFLLHLYSTISPPHPFDVPQQQEDTIRYLPHTHPSSTSVRRTATTREYHTLPHPHPACPTPFRTATGLTTPWHVRWMLVKGKCWQSKQPAR